MAEIRYTAPESPELTTESVSPRMNPDAASMVSNTLSEVSGKFAEKLLTMEQNTQRTKGTLAITDAVATAEQSAMQSKDYNGYGVKFGAAVTSAADAIKAQGYDKPVEQELLARLAEQNIMASHRLDAWAYNGKSADDRQALDTQLNFSVQNGAYASGSERTWTRNIGIADIEARRGNTLSDAAVEETKRAYLEQFDKGAATTDVTSDPRSAIKLLADKTNYPNLDPDTHATLTLEAQRLWKQQQMTDKAGLAALLDNDLSTYYATGHRDFNLLTRAHAIADPDYVKSVDDSYKAVGLMRNAALQIQTAPLADIPKILAQYDPNNIPIGPNAEQEIKGRSRESAVFHGLSADVTAHAYSLLQATANNIQQTALKDYASLSWGEATKGPGGTMLNEATSLEQIIAKNDTIAMSRGYVAKGDPSNPDNTPGHMPQKFVDDFAAKYKSADPTAQMLMLRGLRESAGKYSDNVLGQIAAAMPERGELAFFGSTSPDTYKTITMLGSLPKDKVNEQFSEEQRKTYLQQAQTQFDSIKQALPGNLDQNGAIFKTLYQYTLALADQGVSNPAVKARQLLFEDQTSGYQFRGSWRIPQGVNPDTVINYGREVLNKTTLLSGAPDYDRANLIASGKWIYHDGRGGQDGIYYLRDQNGQQVDDADGKPIKFSIGDARNAEIYKLIHPPKVDLDKAASAGEL